MERVLFRRARDIGLVLALGVSLGFPSARADSPAIVQAPSSQAPAPPAWEKIGDDDGIAVYRREVPGSPLIAFKGEGVINASILRVASVLSDSDRATEWVDSLTESKIIRQVSETETIHYDHIGTPFVLKDRDFVSDCKLEFDPSQKKVILKIQATTDPMAPVTNFVRGELKHSSFTMTSIEHGTKTNVVAEIHADPKGSVANWIVNLFQKGWPHNTLSRLRKQVAKPDIKEHPRLKTVLTDNGYLN
jgi:START domain